MPLCLWFRFSDRGFHSARWKVAMEAACLPPRRSSPSREPRAAAEALGHLVSSEQVRPGREVPALGCFI